MLLFPSTNLELTSKDIAFLTGVISFFVSLQNDLISLSPYCSRNPSSLSASFPIKMAWNSLKISSTLAATEIVLAKINNPSVHTALHAIWLTGKLWIEYCKAK